jgi:DNA-binding MarR family transcriptional regulator
MAELDFDPIERAGDLWHQRVGDPSAMRVATSIMRVDQLLSAEFDRVLRPFGISFARYEVLRMISFSREGTLTLAKIGERLMVHPASVTSAIDRLVSSGLVDRRRDQSDRRRVFASLTAEGEQVLKAATKTLTDIDFGLGAVSAADREVLFDALRVIRAGDWSATGERRSPR